MSITRAGFQQENRVTATFSEASGDNGSSRSRPYDEIIVGASRGTHSCLKKVMLNSSFDPENVYTVTGCSKRVKRDEVYSGGKAWA
jgi:hypothetical protein